MNQPWPVCAASLVAVVVLVLHIPDVAAQRQGYGTPPVVWPVLEVPDPNSFQVNEQLLCGRDKRSYVCDPNGIISKYQADLIDRAILDVYENTTCRGCPECVQNGKGYIIRVAILPRMKRIYPETGNTSYMRLRDAQMYSYILTTRWKMDGICNESLLILYAKYDDILYTLTRQGTTSALPEEDVRTISLGVRSYFDDNDTISQGILEMIHRYKYILRQARS